MSQERLEMPIDKTEIIIPSLTEDTDPLVFSFIKQPESTINELSKKYFAPDPDFFINTEELKKDPIKAAALVRPTEKTYEVDSAINEKNIVRNAILAASKIKTAQDNLSSLPEKQKENFEGFKENFLGSAAFILSSKKIRNPLIALTTMAGLVSGCKSADVNLIPGASLEPTAVTQTNEVTQEATSVPTPTRPDFEGGAGGPYTSEQIQKITNGEFADQENTFKNWMQYWGAAENRPFHPETKDLHYKYLFDGEGNCFVLLEASGDGYEGKLFALPIKNGRFMAVPPETPEGGFEIPEGFGPLMLTGSVAYRDGGLVRLDEDGEVSERLNLETARWEAIKFLSLLPETLGEVEQRNVLRWDHLEDDLAELVEKEKEANTESSEAPEFSVGFPNYDSETLKLPSVVGLTMIAGEGEKISIVSCSYLDLGNGEGLYVLGIPVKRPGSEEIGILHFAMDPELAKEYFEAIGKSQTYDDYNDIQTYYPEATQGEKVISRMGINLILYRGSAEEGGVWDPLLGLLPTEDLNDEYYYYVGDLKKAAYSDDEEARRIFSYFNDKILPCVSIGVIY